MEKTQSVDQRIAKLREERYAREKARIEKLREMNLKKYNKNEPQNIAILPRKPKQINNTPQVKFPSAQVKNNFQVNGTTKRQVSTPTKRLPLMRDKKIEPTTTNEVSFNNVNTGIKTGVSTMPKVGNGSATSMPKMSSVLKTEPSTSSMAKTNMTSTSMQKSDVRSASRVSLMPKVEIKSKIQNKPGRSDARPASRVSLMPKVEIKSKIQDKPGTSRLSMIHKLDTKKPQNNLPADKVAQNMPPPSSRILKEIKTRTEIKTDLSKFALKNSMRKSLALPTKPTQKPMPARKSMVPINNSKQTVFDRLYKPTASATNFKQSQPNIIKPRRSISAVHFKRLPKSEIANCIHSYLSVGDGLNKIPDEIISEKTITSAVKSERKVKFLNPMTPNPEELQHKLKSWLQKRGKSLNSYHHLQCFGLHHLNRNNDENKENIELDSDTDDGSYDENMAHDKVVEDLSNFQQWRHTSNISQSDFNDSKIDDTLTSTETVISDDLVIGALQDLTQLMKEGLDWKQSARWLQAIKDCYPEVCDKAAFWECRAVLEDCKGDMPTSLECWQEAVAKGTEDTLAASNIDQLLDKFMKLNINPSRGQEYPQSSTVDVNNVLKSTIIRFTISQGKRRQSQILASVTPVRRSGRLSVCPSAQKAQLCQNMRQVAEIAPLHQFTPNKNLLATP